MGSIRLRTMLEENTTGRNTHTEVRVEAMTDMPTCFVPCTAARAAGAEVTHVDSVRQVVTWSRENMELSGLEGVRWIVEDALKFVRREVRRGSLYRGIILDPPAYGRGADGERWILEDNIGKLHELAKYLYDHETITGEEFMAILKK